MKNFKRHLEAVNVRNLVGLFGYNIMYIRLRVLLISIPKCFFLFSKFFLQYRRDFTSSLYFTKRNIFRVFLGMSNVPKPNDVKKLVVWFVFGKAVLIQQVFLDLKLFGEAGVCHPLALNFKSNGYYS